MQPLNECNFIEVEASKPGNLKDKYFKSQDINSAITLLKKDILAKSSVFVNTDEINKLIDKYLSTEKYKQSFSGVKMVK